MTPGSIRRFAGVTVLLAGVLLGVLAVPSGAQSDGPLVDVMELSGVIDGTLAGYLDDVIADAEADGAEVLVVQLNTPGGLGVSPDVIVASMAASRVPIVVWVGPSGATATGLGAVIADAGDVLALAPATTLGAAVPADLAAPLVPSAPGDVVAVGDAEALPADAVLPATVDRAAVEVRSPAEVVESGVADLVVAALPDLLAALDGLRVEGPDGSETTLAIDQATADVRFNNLGLIGRILHTAANPTLAYLLVVAGALAIAFELFQPGFGVAGIAGLLPLGLGVFGLTALPVQWWAFVLLASGIVLLGVDLARAGLGALTATGTLMFAVGSFLLFGGSPVLRVPLWVTGTVVAITVVFFVIVMTTVLRAQGSQALVGAGEVVGKVGVVRSMLNPEGHVFIGGALWRARAPADAGKVATGTRVKVLGLDDGMTLDVELVTEDHGA